MHRKVMAFYLEYVDIPMQLVEFNIVERWVVE